MGKRAGALVAGAVLPVMVLVLGALPAAALAAGHPARAAAGPEGPDGPSGDGERPVLTFRDPRISESSGLGVSRAHEGVVYTHNDSDAGAVFYAVGPGGRTRATFTLDGAEARDWEGMAVSADRRTGRGVLWFADIGDNLHGAWPTVTVYRVSEPASLRDATLPATRYRFRYEGGGRDAEGIMVHPRTGRLYVVSKEFSGGVYAAPRRLRTDRVNVLRRVAAAPIMATDAAYAPDGASFVIRTYFSATLYSAPGKSLGRVRMPALRQAESIAYTADGKALLTGSEGVGSPLYRVPIPAGLLPKAAAPEAVPRTDATRTRAAEPVSPSASQVAATGPASPGGVSPTAVLLWLGVALGAIGVIVFIARRAL